MAIPNNDANKIVFRLKFTYQKMRKINRDGINNYLNVYKIRNYDKDRSALDLGFFISKTIYTYISESLVWLEFK